MHVLPEMKDVISYMHAHERSRMCRHAPFLHITWLIKTELFAECWRYSPSDFNDFGGLQQRHSNFVDTKSTSTNLINVILLVIVCWSKNIVSFISPQNSIILLKIPNLYWSTYLLDISCITHTADTDSVLRSANRASCFLICLLARHFILRLFRMCKSISSFAVRFCFFCPTFNFLSKFERILMH